MFTGNPVGVIILFAYISLGATIALFVFIQMTLASGSFRGFINRNKIISALVIIALMRLSFPFFEGVYYHYQQYQILKNKCDDEFGHHEFEMDTTVDGLKFPAGTKVEFSKITFPTETPYQGLSVMSVENRFSQNETVDVGLSYNQEIEGWLCSSSSKVTLNFKKNKGFQLQGCELADGNEISGIKLPKSLWLGYRTGIGGSAWYVYSNINYRWNDQFVVLNGLKFTEVNIMLTPDRKYIASFHGVLGEAATIQSLQYAVGDTITFKELVGYVEQIGSERNLH